jgi:hypothetical protein
MKTTTLKIEFTDEQICDLLCNAFEGGSDYWIDNADIELGDNDVNPNEKFDAEYHTGTPSYLRAPFCTNGFVAIQYGSEEGENKTAKLDRAAIEKGLQLMATTEDGKQHFADWLAGNDDATTGDVFLQLCVLGEIVYG